MNLVNWIILIDEKGSRLLDYYAHYIALKAVFIADSSYELVFKYLNGFKSYQQKRLPGYNLDMWRDITDVANYFSLTMVNYEYYICIEATFNVKTYCVNRLLIAISIKKLWTKTLR